MIRSLRRKSILIAMLSLLGTLAVLCTAISVGNHYAAADRADRAIDLLYENNGEFPRLDTVVDPAAAFRFQVTPETPFETRYFIVELTRRQEVKSMNTEHIAALDRQTVVESINEIVTSGKGRGYVEYYRFKVFQNEDGGSTIIVLDCFLQLQAARESQGCVVVLAGVSPPASSALPCNPRPRFLFFSLFLGTALNSLAHISALAVALAAVQCNLRHSYRFARTLRRTA